MRFRSSLIVALFAACGGGGGSGTGARAPAVAAGGAGAELVAGAHREIFADASATTTWTWRGPGGVVTGVVRWIPAEEDPSDLQVDVKLDGAGGASWHCGPPDCVLECEGNVGCDLGIVARDDSLVISTMWMNKAEFLAENAVEVRWRDGAFEVKDIDPCSIGHTGLWDVGCGAGEEEEE